MSYTQTAADLRWFTAFLSDYLNKLPAEAWGRRTGERPHDWTLQEVIAHLGSIAALLNQAAEAALHRRTLTIDGLTRRHDLRAWNAAQIVARKGRSPEQLLLDWREQMEEAAGRAETLSEQHAEAQVFLHVYNRPARVIDFINWQLSHAGVVHGAQLPRANDDPPLWTHYDEAFTVRQIDRFIGHLSAAYWDDLAGERRAALDFEIGELGHWHILAAPGGGYAQPGPAPQADYQLWYADAPTFFSLFTVALPFEKALEAGLLHVSDDPQTTLGILRFFAASPPKI